MFQEPRMPEYGSDEKSQRALLRQSRRIVLKVGTHVLVDETGKPHQERIARLVDDLASLQHDGYEMVLVSSGAIGAGMHAMNMRERPATLPDLQMAAAVGQTCLLAQYNQLFSERDCLISQVLLTHADLHHRGRHLNARNTMLNLLHHNVVPIVNENDVVAVDEIQVGDNDVLSALVAVLINADALILLTTPDGLQQGEERVPYLKSVDQSALALAHGKTSKLSTGGMETKLKAAQTAAQVGAHVVIASGFQSGVIKDVLAGKSVGTLIGDKTEKISGKRKHWISFFHHAQGSLIVDQGATQALKTQGKSLLAVGIKRVDGDFAVGALVNIVSEAGVAIGCGLVSFSSEQIERIQGHHSDDIESLLGRKDYDEVIHRDNLVILSE